MADQSRLTWALILSVLLHGLLLSLVPLVRRAHIEIPRPPALLDVDVLAVPKPQMRPPVAVPPAPAAPAIPVPERQIVSPPDAGEEKEPENARLLSDRDNTVKEEMVHRDEPAAGNPEAKREAPPQQVASVTDTSVAASAKAERQKMARKPAVEQPASNTHVAAPPKLDELLPAAGDVIRQGLVQPQQPAAAAPEQQASNQRTDLLRHGDPWRTGSLRGGTLDFLPAVRDGDITLLNTKAEQFAPFVRRVAVRVFQNFWILLRRSVDPRLAVAVREFAIVEAIMDTRGQLVEIKVKDRSGSVVVATDRNLDSAIREGFFDRNPPPGAEANDGRIHFLFEAHVQLTADASGRGPYGGALMGAGLL